MYVTDPIGKRVEEYKAIKRIRNRSISKVEMLSKLIGLSEEVIEKEFDKGILDILIELNSKYYFTSFSCEGHLNEFSDKGKNYWTGYLGFRDKYNFEIYPPLFYKNSRDRRFFYWEGFGEESRQEYLSSVLDWARCLPTRERKKIIIYQLHGYHVKRPNTGKILADSQDYEDIKNVLARADTKNYRNFYLAEYVSFV